LSVGNRLGEGGGRRGLVGKGGGASDALELCLPFIDFMLVLLATYPESDLNNVPLRFAQALHAKEFPQSFSCSRSAIAALL